MTSWQPAFRTASSRCETSWSPQRGDISSISATGGSVKWEPGSPAFAAATAEPGPLTPAGHYRHDERVLLGWDPGVWFALCLHLCLLQESTSSQNLAAVGEEGSVGCILQSCCDWNPAACCCCNCLHCNGLLRPVYQMNSKPSNSSTANQGIKMKNLSETWTQCRRVELKSLVSPR